MNNLSLYLLWSDIILYLFVSLIVTIGILFRRNHMLKTFFHKMKKNIMAIISGGILLVYLLVCLLDSIHFKADYRSDYSSNIISVVDILLYPLGESIEQTYSKPFSIFQNSNNNAAQVKLKHSPNDINEQRLVARHVFYICIYSFIMSVGMLFSIFFMFMIYKSLRCHESLKKTISRYCKDTKNYPVFPVAVFILFLGAILLALYHLSTNYHIFGTNKIGQDIFYLSIKSIRTSMLISIFTLLIMIPIAVALGVTAGYFGSKIDDSIQYIYTVISSIPGVLLIAAAVLSLQIYISNNDEAFIYMADRADARLIILCFILGMTTWTSLCRVIRAETLKIRELAFIESAISMGIPKRIILWRHILPNVQHLIIITLVLDFSALILAEAVLSYVGVGVSPTMNSWGNMINGARLELAREPAVWWPIFSAFTFMFILVLSANLFADQVRDILDPKK